MEPTIATSSTPPASISEQNSSLVFDTRLVFSFIFKKMGDPLNQNVFSGRRVFKIEDVQTCDFYSDKEIREATALGKMDGEYTVAIGLYEREIEVFVVPHSEYIRLHVLFYSVPVNMTHDIVSKQATFSSLSPSFQN